MGCLGRKRIGAIGGVGIAAKQRAERNRAQTVAGVTEKFSA